MSNFELVGVLEGICLKLVRRVCVVGTGYTLNVGRYDVVSILNAY